MPLSGFPTATTPVPNRLLDTVMPSLSDTELRVLLIVVRQTLGWRAREGEGRKQRDWITHRQLLTKTGRESAAVSRAIQGLIEKRLIQVEEERGKPLSTAAERRAVCGRLYYRLPALGAEATSESEGGSAENAGTTRKRANRNLDSESSKAKTTKETEDKTLCYAEAVPRAVCKEADGHDSVLTRQTLQFLHRYSMLFRARSYHHAPPPFTWSQEGTLVQQLLRQYDIETLNLLIDLFFRLHDTWVQSQGYSLVAFRHRLPQLLIQARAGVIAPQQASDIPHNQEEASAVAPFPAQKRSRWRFDADKGQFVPDPL